MLAQAQGCMECYRVFSDVAPAPRQFAFRDDMPLVRLEVAEEWVRPEQAVVRYRVETVFARSSWDWIGLYRVSRARWSVTWGRKGLEESNWVPRWDHGFSRV